MTGGRNATQGRIDRIEAQLSERDRLIVDTVRVLGLVTGEQLRQLHFDDHRSLQSSRRTAQQSLRQLADADVLARLGRRVGGVRSGSVGYIYTLGRVGQSLVRRWQGDPQRRTRRAQDPGEAFFTHRLACSQLFVDLCLEERSGRVRVDSYQGEPACWRQRTGPFGKPLTLKPDGYVQLTSGERTLHWFIEMDLATESQTVVARKGRAYLEHYAAGAEPDVMPRVIWVAPDPSRAARMRSTLHALGGPATELHVVTVNERATQTMKGDFA